MARINRARMATEITTLEGGKVSLSVAQVAEVQRLTLALLDSLSEGGVDVLADLTEPAYQGCKAPLKRQLDAAAKRLVNPPNRGSALVG